MKAITVQQPFAFEILSGEKSIEVKDWDTLHRGDLLICSSGKPAFSTEEMEEIEEEYGTAFLYGYALCVVRLEDVRLMRQGDEEPALEDEIDPEAYSWVISDVRPVIPFPVKGKKGVFEVEDKLVEISPFKYDDSVVAKSGTRAVELGLDFSDWHGRTSDIIVTEEGEPRVHVVWDSLSLRQIPVSVIEKCVKEGFDWTGVLMRLTEIEHAEPRDTWDDVQDVLDAIVEENPTLFEDL
ncbi:MAG: ASCH domain-containing protein [Syntrophobacteraceae bacterium]